MSSQKIFKFVKIALLVAILGFSLWLLDKNFTPRGKLTISYNFNREKTPFLQFKGLSESEKTFSEKKWFRRALASPIEIKIKPLRPYKKAKIILEYQNEGNYPLLYLIAKRQTKDFSGEEIRVLENKILDETPWYRIENKENEVSSQSRENLVLLQKGQDKCEKTMSVFFVDRQEKQTSQKSSENLAYEECLYKYSEDKSPDELLKPGEQSKKPWMDYKFENVDEFLKNISQVAATQKIAYFNYDIIPHLKIPDYQSAKPDYKQVFEKTLRGKHQILTYLKDEPLDFTFYFQDLNRKKGENPFGIILKQGNKVFARTFVPDDKNKSSNKKISAEQKISIKKSDLKEGFYQIELNINSDIIINKIETRQKSFAFENQMQLFDPKQDLEFYTNAAQINFLAKHNAASNQEIKIEPQEIEIQKSQEENQKEISTPKTLNIKNLKPYSTSLSGYNKIKIQKNDFNLNYDGLIAFDLETLKNYDFKNLKSLTRPKILFTPENADYIISSSFTPSKQISETWRRQEAEFDLMDLGLRDKKQKISFFLNIPGFDRNRGDFKLRKIKIILEKE